MMEDLIRRAGAGATGIDVGVLYGLVRPRTDSVSLPLSGLAVGAFAMAASDSALVTTKRTDPRQWNLAAALPHAVYGLTTAAALEALTRTNRAQPGGPVSERTKEAGCRDGWL